MHVRHLQACAEFIAGDNSHLREILNPLKETLNIHYSLAWAMVKPGEKTLPHTLDNTEVYYILNGAGLIYINNEETRIKPHDVIYIPAQAVQYVENDTNEPLEFLCIVDPAWEESSEHLINIE
jgi:mannose-6-phosphate isomerase-like protein (cupin superfamily)